MTKAMGKSIKARQQHVGQNCEPVGEQRVEAVRQVRDSSEWRKPKRCLYFH